MVQGIRYVEIALGKSKKHVTSSEKLNKKFSRKSIVANKLILKGERFFNRQFSNQKTWKWNFSNAMA